VADGLIAATAIHRGLRLMTRNVGDFEPTGISIVDPWDDAWARPEPAGEGEGTAASLIRPVAITALQGYFVGTTLGAIEQSFKV
jgi:hypothetical protein